MQGFIKDHRKELESDIWMMPPLYHRVWQYLKYKVNHQENQIPMDDGEFLTIKEGQHLTSIRKIATGIGYYEQGSWKEPNPKTIKKILDWLVKNKMVEISTGYGNTRYTLVSLTQWEKYQIKSEDGNSIETVKKQKSNSAWRETRMSKNEKNDEEVEGEGAAEKNPFEIYQENFGVIRPLVAESITDWCEFFNDEIVVSAMKLGIKNGAHSFSYIEGILKDWFQHGLTTIEEIRSHEKAKKKGGSNGARHWGSDGKAKGTSKIGETRSDEESVTGNRVGWLGVSDRHLSEVQGSSRVD